MLKSPKGLSANTKFEYIAIAEEDAGATKGFALVKELENINGIKAYKIMNEFKGSKYISYVSEKGEVLSTKAPAQSIITELVPQSSMATANMQIPTGLITTLFGGIPLGVKNEVAKLYQDNPKAFQSSSAANETANVTASETAGNENSAGPITKGMGIPAGKGIHLQGGPPSGPGSTPGSVPVSTPGSKQERN